MTPGGAALCLVSPLHMPQMSAMSIVNRTVLTMVSGSRAIIQYLTCNLPVYHKTFAQNNHSANKISTLNTISLHISEPQPIHTSFYSTLCGFELSVIPSNNKNVYLYNEYTDLDAMEKLPIGAISLRPTIPRDYKNHPTPQDSVKISFLPCSRVLQTFKRDFKCHPLKNLHYFGKLSMVPCPLPCKQGLQWKEGPVGSVQLTNYTDNLSTHKLSCTHNVYTPRCYQDGLSRS